MGYIVGISGGSGGRVRDSWSGLILHPSAPNLRHVVRVKPVEARLWGGGGANLALMRSAGEEVSCDAKERELYQSLVGCSRRSLDGGFRNRLLAPCYIMFCRIYHGFLCLLMFAWRTSRIFVRPALADI